MRPQTIATTGTSISSLVVFDWHCSPFEVGIQAVVSGTATYSIQYTNDDVVLGNPASATFSNDANFTNSTTSGINRNLIPVCAARINQTAGNGTVTVTFRQAGLGV